MKTPLVSILYFVAASLLGAVGQFLYKSGAEQATGNWTSYVWNVRILGGVACYVAVMVLFVAAFKRGGELTVLYPIYATTFIWAALISLMVYGIPNWHSFQRGLPSLPLFLFENGQGSARFATY